jgi:hypothetical protein
MGRAARFLAGLWLALLPAGPAAHAMPVDVELVLAVDVSQSMDEGEQALQRAGYVAALTHPEVLDAIRDGIYGRVAIAYLEWGGALAQTVTVPWTLVEDAGSAAALAAALEAAPLQRHRGTSISGALAVAAGLFEDGAYDGIRRIIDVSGDGPNNIGQPVLPVRDAALAAGIIINGLPIMLRVPHGPWGIAELDVYYADCVIGGPGSFVLPVRAIEALAQAIRQKLVLEIAGRPANQAATTPAALRPIAGTDCMIGERLRRMWTDP